MKATDLAIYDWVTYQDKLCVVYEIDAINNTLTLEISMGEERGKRLYNIPIADVKPAPLTEEILVSNGARKEGNYTFFISDWMLDKYATFWA